MVSSVMRLLTLSIIVRWIMASELPGRVSYYSAFLVIPSRVPRAWS
jgi:hypothetical protein